ncbi:sigma 54-interacting transcriptional regulator [Sporolactobacillus spathodeae]|uniref:Transcriptional regulatory protein LevR/transcriptional regulator with AAA-type ATPase domain n=1 Tax=Sporolactobacillus spathodeae TaxID=1465502 RepID=A0ABS2Q9R2_9BACL|nr:sigma-54-dependent transcriptional regulator [Sporolactobacillus spathodeae]MBM7658468.1 transcriptional regulatory protein LevR/transcriptional regulator with AAA-type ATPase domain [Sporolactobacillus spathodeae]
MTRREKVLAYLEKHALSIDQGVTTSEISEAIGVLRPNVSKELNQLVREGKIEKINGRPTHYFVNHATKKREIKVEQQKPTIGFAGAAKISEQSIKEHDATNKNEVDVFENMIGSRDSLKNQVEQAKAALLYPPHGLNTLIIGPTGSGKTYFANKMYHFALDREIISKKGFTTFNCADYAHNPQLLMSHLFGYVKGAFTGANSDKDGLIQEADGGMLFLDEVHRLPPEGQEMIFYFMDHGTYSRLGETTKVHHADVRLVYATTEDPESSLLQTFVRRIPIIIQLPDLKQRSAREKLQLLEQLLTLEANRIHKNIRLNEDVVQALLGSVTYGNVGQLKSNIQLVCAQGFLNSMHDKNEITLLFSQLPPNIKDGLSNLADDRKELGNLSRLLEPTMVIKPDAKRGLPEIDSYELPYNLYEIIGDKATLLKDEGLDQTAINNFIMTDINLHLKSFYRQGKLEKIVSSLNEIVDQEIIDLTKQIQRLLQEKEDYPVRDNFIYAMSLHISSFIKRIQSGKPLRHISSDLISMVHDYPDELKIAEHVKDLIEEHYRFPVPESEVYYMAILLVSLKSEPKAGKVGIVVAAHGNSTASSMVQVVSQLLSVDNIVAYDMPLEMSPKVALDGIALQAKNIDRGNGVLLLVDMGSLSTFSSKLTEKTNIHVKTIDMVTTAMVLEAARKTALIDSDLETVYRELREFNGYSRTIEKAKKKKNTVQKKSDHREKAILAICSTGEGTARRIKELLDEILVDNLIDDITVITVSVVTMKEQIAKIQQDYQIVATTGVVNPQLAVPFVSLENLLQGGGESFVSLIEEINNHTAREAVNLEQSESLTEETSQKYLGQYFTFINPAKIVKTLWGYCDFMQQRSNSHLSNAFKISLIMHLAGAIERYLTRSEMSVPDEKLSRIRTDKLYPIVKQANELLRKKFNINLSDDEVYYIVELFNTEKEKIDTQNK